MHPDPKAWYNQDILFFVIILTNILALFNMRAFSLRIRLTTTLFYYTIIEMFNFMLVFYMIVFVMGICNYVIRNDEK